MFPFLPTQSNEALAQIEDERVFGWDPLPGIVSVWANREGRAVVWQRLEGRVTFTTEHFRPWLFATTLEDLTHLGASLLPSTAPGGDIAPVSYRELDGPEGTYRYLLSARDGRALERLLLSDATRRLGRQVNNLNDLPETYYRVGPVEQYLMLSGRVYFRGMVYDDLHRLTNFAPAIVTNMLLLTRSSSLTFPTFWMTA